MTQLMQAWAAFQAERAINLQATSLSTDYNQAKRWLERCPVQDLERGREILYWVYSQQPRQAAIRVGMFVKALYKWACSDGVDLLAHNPTLSVKAPKPLQKESLEVRAWSDDEAHAIIEAMRPRRVSDTPWCLLVEFMLATGLRTGEAFALRFDDIQDGRAFIHANHTLTHGLKPSTKTNQPRWVPLNGRARDIVEIRRQHGGEFLFPWCRESFQTVFRERAAQLYRDGVLKRPTRIYDARHTAISRWMEQGIPIAQAAAWAGNSREVIFKHYCGVTQQYQMPES
jgi:integrase